MVKLTNLGVNLVLLKYLDTQWNMLKHWGQGGISPLIKHKHALPLS